MRSVLVTMTSWYKVTMTSFCVQRGEGVKKSPKNAVILKVCPLILLTSDVGSFRPVESLVRPLSTSVASLLFQNLCGLVIEKF